MNNIDSLIYDPVEPSMVSMRPTVSMDAGFTLTEIFPKRIRRPRRPLIEQVSWPKAREAVVNSVSYIKTVPSVMHPRLERMLVRVFKGRSTRDGLIKWLVEKGEVSEARARFIADDQMAKISEALLRAKWMKRGVKFVRWIHGDAPDPREYHRREWDGHSGADGRPNGLNGFVFEIGNPPVIDTSTNDRGYPAQLPGCTCRLEPVK